MGLVHILGSIDLKCLAETFQRLTCHNFREVQTICSRTDPFDFQLVEYGPSALLGPLVNSSQLNPYTTDKPADTWRASGGSDNRPMRTPDVLRIDAGAVREGNTFRQLAI